MITAEEVYRQILEMPINERERLFVVIARKGFEKDLYNHDEVFDEIRQSPFTIKEAAEYLEIAEITLRRWVKAERVAYKKVGRNIVFDVGELKALKKLNRKK
ncbi:helix-turn-helix domain-containing protein [Thermodesulfobacteriota bacterium]